MGALKPIPTCTHGGEKNRKNIPNSLTSAKFVFVRRENRKLLQPPYDGPYEVLEKADKYFTLQIGSRTEKISVDRLKGAIVDSEKPVSIAQPPRRGRPPGATSNVQDPLDTQDGQDVRRPPMTQKPTYADVTSGSSQRQMPQGPVTTRFGRSTKLPERYRNY